MPLPYNMIKSGPFKRRTVLGSSGSNLIVDGLDGDLHKVYKISFSGSITGATPLQYAFRVNGLTTGYKARNWNYAGSSTDFTSWRFYDIATTPTAAAFWGHGILYTDRSLGVEGVRLNIVTNMFEGSGTGSSQRMVGTRTSDPGNVTEVRLFGGSGDTFDADTWLQVEELITV